MTDRAPAGADDRSFDAIVSQYHQRVYNVALRYLGDADEAADVTQETFINAYRSFGRFRGDAGVYTWLYRIAINNCRNHVRRRRIGAAEAGPASAVSLDAQVPLDPPDPGASPQQLLEAAEMRDRIAAAVLSLDPDYREVVILREIEGLGYAEIAQVTGHSQDLIRTRLSRARAMLRRKLEAYYRGL